MSECSKCGLLLLESDICVHEDEGKHYCEDCHNELEGED